MFNRDGYHSFSDYQKIFFMIFGSESNHLVFFIPPHLIPVAAQKLIRLPFSPMSGLPHTVPQVIMSQTMQKF